MARFHDIDSDIWEDLLDHSPKQKLLYVYLCTNSFSRPSGLYKITVKTIKHHTGATEGDIKGLCGGLIEYDFETQEVFVRGKFKRILSGFKNNEKMRLAVKHDFDSFSSLFIKHLFVKKYEGALEGLVSPPLPLPLPLPLPISLKEEKNSEKKKSKVPESLSEVTTYFSEIGSSSEAPAFFDHFSEEVEKTVQKQNF
jgi:hypothetical protein